jgi:Na+-transporting NADH:ubiquinone oxidoreductase subunit C
VTGIAFYEQNETPGLGGEIVKSEFTQQFVGKKLATTAPYIQFLPASTTLDTNSVHAITGATQTSNRLGKFVNAQLLTWRGRVKE